MVVPQQQPRPGHQTLPVSAKFLFSPLCVSLVIYSQAFDFHLVLFHSCFTHRRISLLQLACTIFTMCAVLIISKVKLCSSISPCRNSRFPSVIRVTGANPEWESERQEYRLERSSIHPHIHSQGKFRVSSQLTLTSKVES